MSANVDVPYTRRNVSVLSQNSTTAANARMPRPINESMVRERLSVNLPDSFHYLNNTLPMGRRRTQSSRHHHHYHRHSSNSSSSDSSHHSNEDSEHRRLDGSTRDAATGQDTAVAPQMQSEHRNRRSRLSSPHSSNHSSSDSSRRSSSSSSSSDDGASKSGEDDYNFYARLVKLDCSDGGGQPSNATMAAAAFSSPQGNGNDSGVPLVAQCCDTVRGTIDLLNQIHLSTSEPENHDKFFWLDLHGVPPPLPGSPEWGQRPRRWQRKQEAALRAATQAAAQGRAGCGRLPEVEMQVLWNTLGLQRSTVQSLTAVCQQRQLAPRPDRTSLDDVYEEEMVALTCPDDRILQVEPLSMRSEATATVNSEPISPDVSREDAASPRRREGDGEAVRVGQSLSSQPSVAARLGATHYVVMELATLLSCVPATTISVSAGAWSSTFLAHVGSYDFTNEPLNDAVWTETMRRGMHVSPANLRAAAAARRAGMRGGRHNNNNSNGRQLAQSNFYAAELPLTPLITSTYVICFPGGCVTWCPGSTLGLVSAERQEKRRTAAQERRQRRHGHHHHFSGSSSSSSSSSSNASSDAHSDGDSDVDDTLEVQCVKSWEQLQASVFHRLRHMAACKGSRIFPGATLSAVSAAATDAPPSAPVLCTSGFVSLLLSAVCYAYMPNTTSVLGEVDAIDSMLPLVGLNVESDQADALRRVLLLRRRLAVHRRLLFQKTRLLEALDRPAMHTIARFVRTVKAPSWVRRAATGATARVSATASTCGTLASECHRRESDTNSLSGVPMSHPHEHASAPLSASATVGGGDSEGMPIVHFVNTNDEEAPWSMRTAEQTYGGAHGGKSDRKQDNNERSYKDMSTSCFPAGEEWEGYPSNRQNGNVLCAWRSQPHIAEPPSLNVIHKGISNVLRNLEVARTVLGNTTLIYTSTVNYNNSRTSESSDYFALICQYMLLIVLPLSIVASHWGMNCAVPFMNVEGTTPFWSIVGIMAFLAIAGLAVPLYAYRTGRIDMIS